MAIHLTEQARQDVTIGKGTIYLDSDTGELNVAGRTVPHIIPGVLYPAISGNDLSGTALGGSYVYGTAHTDGRKYYYTDIKGSKPIKDPRIGGHFGSQRHKTKSLQLLEQETATHGKNVYSVDGREWVRCVDGTNGWNVRYESQGNAIEVNQGNLDETDFMEITGYFNFANVSVFTNTDHQNQTSIFLNGTDTSNNLNAQNSVVTPLLSRFVDPGGLMNLDIGTVNTPGINTIKLAVGESSSNNRYAIFYAIELIAQDTSNRNNIQIPSQDVVSHGKKFNVSGTPHYDPFNGFTSGSSVSSYIDTDTSLGVENWKNSSTYYRPYNGGRVVKWVDSSGVIKTSVTLMPPNAKSIADSSSLTNGTAKANASVANDTFYPTFEAHTTDVNEDNLHEVAKTFHFREFGNGSANGNITGSYPDASMLDTGTNRDIAYVMDDGLTSLSGDDVRTDSTRGTIRTDGINDTYYITFIGTGFTFTNQSGGTTFGNGDDFDFIVDGVVVKSWQSGSTINEKTTVVQNLPYGTHVFQMLNTAAPAAQHMHAKEFTFHQPKRPPIPEDACVIADYMLMADYVANTSGSLSNISKGVRMISSSRDVFYDATSTSDLAYNHTADLGIRTRGSRVRWGNIGSGGTDGPIITYFGHPKVDYHIGTSGDGSERYHLKLTNSSGTLETTNVSGTTSSGSISNHEITGVSTSNGSAYFSSSKSDGVLGANKGELIAYPDDATYDWLYFGDAYVATPIHTSHHYQPFETPFLHELVGGDRNMEQTNLVCSPDGKTWDEVTRDTSYIGNVCVKTSTDTGTAWETVVVFDEWRGSNYNYPVFNKFFAIAYDRLICLEDGFYNITSQSRAENGGTVAIKLNSNYVSKLTTATSDEMLFGSSDINLKRGDTIQLYGEYGLGSGDAELYNKFTIKRLNK